MEGDLGRFREGCEQQQAGDSRIEGARHDRRSRRSHLRHAVGAGQVDEQHAGSEQCQAAGARDDQHLECGGSRGRPLVLEADEQVRREPGQLPEHEQRENVVAENHAEHRSHEGEQRGMEAAGLRVAFQVAARVQHDQRADARDEDREQQSQSVEVDRQRQSQRGRPRQLEQTSSLGRRSPHFVCEKYGQERRPGRQDSRTMRKSTREPRGGDCDDERREDDGDHC